MSRRRYSSSRAREADVLLVRIAERYGEPLDLDDLDLGWLRAVEQDDARDDRRDRGGEEADHE